MIESSIQRDGFGRSILLANDGTVIAGNATYDAAASAGLDDVIVVETDGTKVVAVKRTDVAPGSKEFHNLALADNRAAELAGWDGPVIAALIADDVLDPRLFWNDDEFAAVLAEPFIPEPDEQAQPMLKSERFVEISCTNAALEAMQPTLAEWSLRDDITINIS